MSPLHNLKWACPDFSNPGRDEQSRDAPVCRHLVAFPTETVYGLGANALDPIAVAKIYAVKRRPPTSPLIVHVASIDMAKSLVATWPEAAARLTKKFWPGPLTLVLPIKTDGESSMARAVEPKLHLFNYPRDLQEMVE